MISFLFVSSSAQCPDEDGLRKQVLHIKDSLKAFPEKQLAGLLDYQRKVNHCRFKMDSNYTLLLSSIEVAYAKTGDYLKAVEYCRAVIKIITDNLNSQAIKQKNLPAKYYYLSIYFDSLKNFGGKMNALDSCSTIAIRLKHMDRASLMALYTQIEYYYDIGDYQRCIDHSERCILLAYEYSNKNSGVEKTVGEFYAMSSLGWQIKALLNLNRFERAEELLRNKIVEYKKQGLKNYLGLAYAQLAEVRRQGKNFEEALNYFNASLQFYQAIKDSFNCKQTLKDIGYLIYFLQFHDRDKAITYYRKALKYETRANYQITAGAASDISETLNIYTRIANVFVEKGLYDSARHYFRMAFDQIKQGADEQYILRSSPAEFSEYKTVHYLASLFIDKGDAFKREYEATGQSSALQNSIRVYRQADQLLDRIKAEQTDLESKLFWRSDSRRLYEHAIEACYVVGNAKDAFYFFEKSRAVLLSDQLNEQRWLGEHDILKQTQLKRKIQQLERDLNSGNKSSNQYALLRNELLNSKQQLEQLEDIIRTTNPLYYQSFVEKNFITVDDVREKLLKDRQALVEMFTGDSANYTLVITANKNYLQKVNKYDFDSLSTAYLAAISNFEWLNKNFTGFVQLSYNLFRIVFANITLPPGRIIVSPAGQYLPFEAMITNVQTQRYFLDDYAVSYTYSARYLLNGPDASMSSSENFFGIAPVKYSNGLSALDGSDQSLRRMENYFRGAKTLVSFSASKNNFLKQFNNYRIVQLYTHATASGDNGEPTIYFADSALRLSELLYGRRPAAKLIVLSACETASGELYRGEGVFSFNRAFAALGIPSAVSNLWRVDNQSTYRLTELFYKYVADGMPLDLALQQAKKEFIKSSELTENRLPYYWAACILVGNSDTIPLHGGFSWKWLTAIIMVPVLIFWGWRIIKKNRLS